VHSHQSTFRVAGLALKGQGAQPTGGNEGGSADSERALYRPYEWCVERRRSEAPEEGEKPNQPEKRGEVKRVHRSGLRGELFDKPVDGLPRPGITVENGPDFADRVQHRGVILAAEGPADLGERGVGELPRQIHGDLTGEGHHFRPILGLQLGELDAEEFGNLPLNQLDRSSWVRSFPAMN
jgi:hypothetical protein